MTSDTISPSPYFLLSQAELLAGKHMHPAWRGQVGNRSTARAKPMILKWLDSHLAICIEFASALAAQCLKLPVPVPGIVIAERNDLPGLPYAARGEQIILIGSEYKVPDAFFAQATNNNPAAEEFVWSKLCASSSAASGAAWDELVANDDRHFQNALFDGENWWLFDHDRALPSSVPFCKNPNDPKIRAELINFRAKCNILAVKTVERHQNNHGIQSQPASFEKHKAKLALLATAAKKWSHSESRLNEIYVTTAILLGAIELRLPALAQHIQTRIKKPGAEELLWE
jgi:hypothetical protein